MLVGIHESRFAGIDYVIQKYKKILTHNKINFQMLDSNHLDFWQNISRFDAFIYYWGHFDVYRYHAKTILPIIEKEYCIKCVPNHSTCWHYDDKIKQYLLLEAHGFPVVNSWIFWNKIDALDWLESKAEFPLVFKLTGGAGSSNVVLLKNKGHAISLTKRMFGRGILPGKIPNSNDIRFSSVYNFMRSKSLFVKKYFNKDLHTLNWNKHKNYVYFQEYLPHNDFDTRVTTIGDRTFSFRRYVRKNDFRASGSNNWSLDREFVDMEMIKIAQEITQKMKFQVMAFDFIYDQEKKPKLVEISYTYGDYPEFSTGYINRNFEWIDGSFWTQYLVLMDLLKLNDLKQPDMKPERWNFL